MGSDGIYEIPPSPLGPIMSRWLFADTIIIGTTLNFSEDKEPKNINIRTLQCSVLQ